MSVQPLWQPPDGTRIVLGSQSPQRRDLLRLLVDPVCIEVLPPRESEEAGFDGISDWPQIERQLLRIACAKSDDVRSQLQSRDNPSMIVTADTVIVGTAEDDTQVVLGKPPLVDDWRATVRDWFTRFYLGRPHDAVTGLCVANTVSDQRVEKTVRTKVLFAESAADWLEQYLATDEPIGKAGGYGIQGMAGVFVSRVEGEISNVVGLPLRATLEALQELDVTAIREVAQKQRNEPSRDT